MSEAELVAVGPTGGVVDLGKGMPSTRTAGEFIGMGKLSAKGAALARVAYEEAEASHARSGTHPFERAKCFERAYLTDLFLHLARSGTRVDACYVDDGFMEIDTPQDLRAARARFTPLHRPRTKDF